MAKKKEAQKPGSTDKKPTLSLSGLLITNPAPPVPEPEPAPPEPGDDELEAFFASQPKPQEPQEPEQLRVPGTEHLMKAHTPAGARDPKDVKKRRGLYDFKTVEKATLNFTVSDDFKTEFGVWCKENKMSQVAALAEAFDLLKEKYPAKKK